MLAFLQTHILTFALGAIPVAAIVALLHAWVKKASDTVDALPAWAHSGALALVAVGLTALGRVLGVNIVCADGANCLSTITDGTLATLVQGAIAAAAAFAVHLAQTKSTPAPAVPAK